MATRNPELLIDSVYARLRELIISDVLRAGQKLVDRDLAEQLGVSRTPVREALGRLAMMGLVEARSRQGYYVREYSAKEVIDLYKFRAVLEVFAARLAAKNAQPSHLREFDRLLADSEKLASDPANQSKILKSELELHELIARASGNGALHHALHNLMDKVMGFIWIEVTTNRTMLDIAHTDHQALIHKIKEKDEEGAAELMGRHIASAQETLAEAFRARDELRSAVLSATPTISGKNRD
ncbi:MAG: GntR family transcriptional regulator [Gammaproteobacteria bacterium]|nr:GntR family transcriptional regulator [Gammaproteobacteria bacterium]